MLQEKGLLAHCWQSPGTSWAQELLTRLDFVRRLSRLLRCSCWWIVNTCFFVKPTPKLGPCFPFLDQPGNPTNNQRVQQTTWGRDSFLIRWFKFISYNCDETFYMGIQTLKTFQCQTFNQGKETNWSRQSILVMYFGSGRQESWPMAGTREMGLVWIVMSLLCERKPKLCICLCMAYKSQ